MSGQAVIPHLEEAGVPAPLPQRVLRKNRNTPSAAVVHFSTHPHEEETAHRQAELFYLQKQIQSQTPMVIVMEDGEELEGCIEWYDRHTLKVRGRSRILIFKSAIKYMYKHGEIGQ